MTEASDKPQHWALRAQAYNRLKWVSNPRLLEFVVTCAQLQPHHRLLDVGTGSGAVARACAPHVSEVLAVDFCPEMLAQRPTNHFSNLRYAVADVRCLPYDAVSFDRVTARNVFHNILSDSDRVQAVRECHRVLRPGGRFVLSEGVPPASELLEDFRRIFALKEERVVFTSESLRELLGAAGFAHVEFRETIDPEFDLANWVENDTTLTDERRQQILELHTNGTEAFRRIYNLRTINGRVYIDTRAACVIGAK